MGDTNKREDEVDVPATDSGDAPFASRAVVATRDAPIQVHGLGATTFGTLFLFPSQPGKAIAALVMAPTLLVAPGYIWALAFRRARDGGAAGLRRRVAVMEASAVMGGGAVEVSPWASESAHPSRRSAARIFLQQRPRYTPPLNRAAAVKATGEEETEAEWRGGAQGRWLRPRRRRGHAEHRA